LNAAVTQPLSLDTVIDFLVASPLFAGLDESERTDIVRIMEVQRLNDGEQLFREGDAGDAWFVIYEGLAEVVKEGAHGQTRVAMLEPGSCFGEMAMLDGSPRSATVRASGPLTVFRFRRMQFEQLLADGILSAYKMVATMARTLCQRHRKLTHQISEMVDHRPTGAAFDDEKTEEIAVMINRFQVSE
jgi:CRP/FNR family transcriptional regulator, cyclic AMP receptor protein